METDIAGRVVSEGIVRQITTANAFKWNRKKERAALLVAEGELTHDAIADKVGIAEKTLTLWKRIPDFRYRVQEHIDTYRKAILSQGIADRVQRVQRLNEDWKRLQAVRDARAKQAKEYADAHGGKEEAAGMLTGHLCKTLKGVGKGENFHMVEVYAVDTGTLAELRNIEQQAAKECGQWLDKTEISTKDDKPLLILRGVSMDDI